MFNVLLSLGLFAAVIIGVTLNAHWSVLNETKSMVVGKTPEGFHRKDALELVECLQTRPADACDPYNLPGYRNHPGVNNRPLPE